MACCPQRALCARMCGGPATARSTISIEVCLNGALRPLARLAALCSNVGLIARRLTASDAEVDEDLTIVGSGSMKVPFYRSSRPEEKVEQRRDCLHCP